MTGHPRTTAAGVVHYQWGPGQRRKASLTFSPAFLRLPVTTSAFPSAFSRSFPVAFPASLLVLPLITLALFLAFFSAPMTGSLSCRQQRRCPASLCVGRCSEMSALNVPCELPARYA